jgi:hypothetical protein
LNPNKQKSNSFHFSSHNNNLNSGNPNQYYNNLKNTNNAGNNQNNYYNQNQNPHPSYQSPQISQATSTNSLIKNSLSQVSTEKAFNQIEVSEEEFMKLTERRDKLLNKVLVEEESYFQNHRSHFDEMVEIMKEVRFEIIQEMNAINNFSQQGSDIDLYVNTMEKIFSLQLEKVNFMKMRLANFKNLLKEEEDISSKIMKMNEMMTSMYENSFHTESTVNNILEDFSEQ